MENGEEERRAIECLINGSLECVEIVEIATGPVIIIVKIREKQMTNQSRSYSSLSILSDYGIEMGYGRIFSSTFPGRDWENE